MRRAETSSHPTDSSQQGGLTDISALYRNSRDRFSTSYSLDEKVRFGFADTEEGSTINSLQTKLASIYSKQRFPALPERAVECRSLTEDSGSRSDFNGTCDLYATGDSRFGEGINFWYNKAGNFHVGNIEHHGSFMVMYSEKHMVNGVLVPQDKYHPHVDSSVLLGLSVILQNGDNIIIHQQQIDGDKYVSIKNGKLKPATSEEISMLDRVERQWRDTTKELLR